MTAERSACLVAKLRIYIGAAPGVGKTNAMLGEGRAARDRARDVVVGFVETYGRPLTQEAIGGLEVSLEGRSAYRGSRFEEMDTDAVLARLRSGRSSTSSPTPTSRAAGT